MESDINQKNEASSKNHTSTGYFILMIAVLLVVLYSYQSHFFYILYEFN